MIKCTRPIVLDGIELERDSPEEKCVYHHTVSQGEPPIVEEFNPSFGPNKKAKYYCDETLEHDEVKELLRLGNNALSNEWPVCHIESIGTCRAMINKGRDIYKIALAIQYTSNTIYA